MSASSSGRHEGNPTTPKLFSSLEYKIQQGTDTRKKAAAATNPRSATAYSYCTLHEHQATPKILEAEKKLARLD